MQGPTTARYSVDNFAELERVERNGVIVAIARFLSLTFQSQLHSSSIVFPFLLLVFAYTI